MRIGVDVDSVLADMMQSVCDLYFELYGRPMTPSDWVSWNFFEECGFGTRKQFYVLMDQVWLRPGGPRLLEARTGVYLRNLRHAGHSIHIITGRNERTAGKVVDWVLAHDLSHDSITFVASQADKFNFNMDVLIDDSPKFVEVLLRGKLLYLRDQPWNRSCAQGPGIIRVQSLEDAYERVMKTGGSDEHQAV